MDQIALNIDLAPTFLDFAGVPVPKEMHGRSWRSLLEGRAADDWRRSFFYCYFRERQYNIPAVTAVRTETAKLIKYPGHEEWTELFDLQHDPYELQNLVHAPSSAALREQLEAEYLKQAAAISFPLSAAAEEGGPTGPAEKPRRKKKPTP